MESQLRVLQKDQYNLRSAMTATVNERAKVEQDMHDLQQAHRSLTRAGREAQQKLGKFHGTTSLWQEEHNRLTLQRKEDRQKLLECAHESEEGEEDETKRNKSYCSEMKKLNNEHAGWLWKLESSRLRTLLTPETLIALRHLWAKESLIDKQSEEKNDEVCHRLETSVRLWHQASQRLTQEAAANKHLRQKIEAFRYQVLSSSNASELQLLSEEQSWSGNNCNPAIGIDPLSFESPSSAHGEAPHKVHMADFYCILENENELGVMTEEAGCQSLYQPAMTSCPRSQEQEECPLSEAGNECTEQAGVQELGGVGASPTEHTVRPIGG